MGGGHGVSLRCIDFLVTIATHGTSALWRLLKSELLVQHARTGSLVLTTWVLVGSRGRWDLALHVDRATRGQHLLVLAARAQYAAGVGACIDVLTLHVYTHTLTASLPWILLYKAISWIRRGVIWRSPTWNLDWPLYKSSLHLPHQRTLTSTVSMKCLIYISTVIIW